MESNTYLKVFTSASLIENGYPVILVPDKIIAAINDPIEDSDIITKTPDLNEPALITFSKPYPPKKTRTIRKPETSFETENLPGILILAIILGPAVAWAPAYFLSFLLPFSEYLTFLSVVLLSTGIIIYRSTVITTEVNREVPISDQEYEARMADFKKRFEVVRNINERRKKEFEEKKRSVRKSIEARGLREKLYYEKLSSDILTTSRRLAMKRGRSEIFFLKELLNCFGSQVLMDNRLDVPFRSYQPDFILVCEITGVHIDIEIDEPYAFSDKTPVHYIGSSDNERNQFFLDSNWVVIRFSERQIIEQTRECIIIISNVLKSIREKSKSYKASIVQDDFWTYEEALVMANEDFRNSYLNKLN